MKVLTLLLIVTSLLCFVAGQLLLKASLDDDSTPGVRGWSARRTGLFVAGIFGMTVSFFLNLGLLQRLDLSFCFRFRD